MNLKKTGLATASALAMSTSLAGMAGATSLIVAHGFQPNHVNYAHGLQPWEDCVSSRTNGSIEFQNFPGGQISGHRDSITSLNTGIAQVSGVVPGYESSRMPLSNIPELPGMGTTAVQMNAVFREMLDNGSPIAQEWAGLNLMPLISMVTPAYQLMSTGGPVTTIEGFDGMKVRASPGAMSHAVDAVGGIPIEMASTDMYVALQRGTVDATILSMTSAPAYNLQELVHSASTNGAFASGHTVWAMNLDTFNGLTADEQAAVTECAAQVELDAAQVLDQQNTDIMDQWRALGITMYEFPPDLVAELDRRLGVVGDEFVNELEARGLPARATYDMYRQALANH